MSVANQRAQTVTWEDPVVSAEAVKPMSGLEFLKAICRGEVPLPPICELVGFELAELEESRVVFKCVPGEQHYNPIGDSCTEASLAPCSIQWWATPYTPWCWKTQVLHHPRAQDEPPTLDSAGYRNLAQRELAYLSREKGGLPEARLTHDSGLLYTHVISALMVYRPKKKPPEGDAESEPSAMGTC